MLYGLQFQNHVFRFVWSVCNVFWRMLDGLGCCLRLFGAKKMFGTKKSIGATMFFGVEKKIFGIKLIFCAKQFFGATNVFGAKMYFCGEASMIDH